jgi:hypothetical protein
MSKFDDVFKVFLDGAKDSAGQAAHDFLKEATVDSAAFALAAKADLQRWTIQRANNEIDDDMLKDLVRGQWDTAVLAALAKAGHGAAQAGQLRDKIINTAISAAFTILL